MFGLSRLAVQLIASGGVLALVLGGVALRDNKVRATERTAIKEASTNDGKKRQKKAEQAHVAARQPGAIDRLGAALAVCRDCN